MATTSLWAVRSGLKHLVEYVSNEEKTIGIDTTLNYISNDDKTMNKQYVTCLNCNCLDPYSSMVTTKKQFNDEKEILAFHGYQSFDAGEVDASKAHEIGVELANRLWGERFEVVVTTHLNTEHYHNHFLINATSFVDGKRYCNTNDDIKRMRQVNDEICLEHGLSIVENPSKEHNYLSKKRAKEMIKRIIDEAINESQTYKQFELELLSQGFELNGFEDSMSVKHPDMNTPIRLKSLGNNYMYERIIQRILDHDFVPPIYARKGFDMKPVMHRYKFQKLTPLQKTFIHYQYVLGILPKNNTKRKRYSKETMKALAKLDAITDQTIFLCKNEIDDLDELRNIRIEKLKELKPLLKERQQLYNKQSKTKDPHEIVDIRERLQALKDEIKEKRKVIKLCDDIADRSTGIDEFFKQEYQKIKQKELER